MQQESTTEKTFTVIETLPLSACFHWSGGTRHYYAVRVSPAPYGGSPWAVAYEDKDGALKADSFWFRTSKAARKEFKDAERERAYFLFEAFKGTMTLTY